MRVVIAPDKFRGSLTAPEAAQAIARGVRRAVPDAEISLVPLADGGEGIVETLLAATNGISCDAEVTGPLGQPVQARFGVLGDGETAVLAMASASGLNLVVADRRDPVRASTRGTGELMLTAIALPIRRLILGIGGSATNDGGAGMAQALGYRLLDRDGRELGPGGSSLADLDRIDALNVNPALDRIKIEVACDVANPLCGPNGASHVYGPQKGATPEQVRRLDANLEHLAIIIKRDLGVDVLSLIGGGAAGGLGAGLVAFAGATLRSGIDLVIDAVGLRDQLAGADLCLTGEGAFDESTLAGKTVAGVAAAALAAGVPCFALAGSVYAGSGLIHQAGVTATFAICPGPVPLDRALAEADAFLAATAEQATRAFRAGVAARR